jgi:heme/copper-type cytochrome/quinol oxidase subunit 1
VPLSDGTVVIADELYMVSITLFFFVGGTAAALMRLELLSPKGDLVTSETYNKLFTIHGVVMVWFFLTPPSRPSWEIFSCP